MNIDRLKQKQFIQDELKAQTDAFKQKLETTALDLLLEKNEVFVGMFIKFMDNGEALFKFPVSRALPRKNSHYYCFTLPDVLKRYKDWGNLSYGDLIKKETCATNIKCVWYASSDNPKFMLTGCKGATEDFKKYIEKVPGGIVVLGPEVPPYEYLANLGKVCHSYHPKCTEILDANYEFNSWAPSLLSHDMNLSDIVLEDFKVKDVVIVQGPPGTGKTHRISQLCDILCEKGFSVLVTALTNRALIEVADKLRETLIKEHKVYKTNLTTDEAKEVNGIQNAEKVYAIPGNLMLSTFYIASGSAVNGYEGPLFDYVIVDEASQAFFAMLAAANMLGNKNLWVGDVYQMPPIVIMSNDRIKRLAYEPLVNGLETITASTRYPNYQLSDTFRLGTNAAKLTGLFYKGALRSLARESNMFSQKKEGPVIVPIDMPIGDPIPSNAIKEAVRIASDLIQQNKKIEIAILSLLIKTTTALQVEVARTIGNANNILVETVARVQGITKDVTIYVIPNTDSMVHSLELRLFNVATSRAKDNTYIICPKDILSYTFMAPLVREYLVNLIKNN